MSAKDDTSEVVEVEVKSGGLVFFNGKRLKGTRSFHAGTVRSDGVDLVYSERETSHTSKIRLPGRGDKMKVKIFHREWRIER